MTLFWRTEAPLDTRYKITVQMLDENGLVAAQHDSEPANNRAMTIDWHPDETVIDNHGLVLPPGAFRLIVGIYELGAPQNRLLVNGSDSLELERITLP